MSEDFNPNSLDAQLADVRAQLRQIRETQIENQTLMHAAFNRIAALEAWKLWIYGVSAGISAVVGVVAWGIAWVFSKH